ncbi:hypothetical protein K0M31_019743 [Melipona bicolor]|uniref:Uncharacterized protein n=1 Tax=Melipona bicolor TaxID=60889 RepID=A0AA40G3F5_9HYME|nr:hypothetical protein K0M31_019743 [Melipona bicolor]
MWKDKDTDSTTDDKNTGNGNSGNDSDSINPIKVYYKHFNNGQYWRFSRENFSHKVPSKADSNRRENDFRKFADTGVKPWKKARREKIIWKPSSAVKAGRHNGVQGYP